MRNDFAPTPGALLAVLEILGDDLDELLPDGSPTKKTYPLLVGRLRAAIEITSTNVLTANDREVEAESYRDAFLEPSDDDDDDDFDWPKAWEAFLQSLVQAELLLSYLHGTENVTARPSPFDRSLSAVADKTAAIGFYATDMRLGLSKRAHGGEWDSLRSGVQQIQSQVSALSAHVGLFAMDVATDEDPDEPYVQYVSVDLGDDYAAVMAGYLDRMVAGGHIEDWEHQPRNGGNGNGSICLHGGGKLANLVMNFEDALEYAHGYMTAVEDQANKGKEN